MESSARNLMSQAEEHQLVLSITEQEILVDMLVNPPEPNAALRKAAEDYFRTVTS